MAETDAQKVERLAEGAVEQAVGRRAFTITKFERHPDGYMHAHVTPAGGKAIYVFNRWGCWQAPGAVRKQAVLKDVKYDVAIELQRKARALKRAEKGGESTDGADTDADATGGGETDV